MLKTNETIQQAARAAPLLSKELEASSAYAWQRDGDVAARELLYRSHLRLLIRIVSRMKGQAARFDDLLSAGSIGLLVAIDRFDPETGFRLSTYATFWIRSHINDDTYSATNVIRLPSSERFKRAIARYHDARRRIGVEHGGRLTHREVVDLAAVLDVPVEVAEIVDARHDGWSVSMQAPTPAKDGAAVFGDRFESQEPSPHQILASSQRDSWAKELVAACLDVLKPREREVFVRREIEEDCTLQDLADEFGVTRERIRQIQVKAAGKFAKAAMRHRAMAHVHLGMPDSISHA